MPSPFISTCTIQYACCCCDCESLSISCHFCLSRLSFNLINYSLRGIFINRSQLFIFWWRLRDDVMETVLLWPTQTFIKKPSIIYRVLSACSTFYSTFKVLNRKISNRRWKRAMLEIIPSSYRPFSSLIFRSSPRRILNSREPYKKNLVNDSFDVVKGRRKDE